MFLFINLVSKWKAIQLKTITQSNVLSVAMALVFRAGEIAWLIFCCYNKMFETGSFERTGIYLACGSGGWEVHKHGARIW
jgi:hypothetical protein